jgi:hypothetical protein
LVEDHYERFEQVYPERYEARAEAGSYPPHTPPLASLAEGKHRTAARAQKGLLKRPNYTLNLKLMMSPSRTS